MLRGRFVSGHGFAEDCEIRPYLGPVLEASTYPGHQGVARWFADANEPWERLIVEALDFHDAGNFVVVPARLVGRGAGSGVDVDAEIAHVALVGDGKIRRFDGYASRAGALEAVGLGD